MLPYNSRFFPSAPVIDVVIENPVFPNKRLPIQGIIDTGADITAIPVSVVRRLGIQVSRRMSVAGLNGKTETIPTYIANLRVADLSFERIQIIEWPGTEVVLGREILNNFELFLDGKNRRFEIKDP